MSGQVVIVERTGHVVLPKQALEALGVHQDIEVIVELTDQGVTLKPKGLFPVVTARIAAMDLPVDEWEQMEKEIEAGRLA